MVPPVARTAMSGSEIFDVVMPPIVVQQSKP
jgi:hypothetical protein